MPGILFPHNARQQIALDVLAVLVAREDLAVLEDARHRARLARTAFEVAEAFEQERSARRG